MREFLVIGSAVLGGWFSYRQHATLGVAGWRALRWPLGLLLALTLWMVVVALFIAPETRWSLDEIRGQWSKALLAFTVGVLSGLVFSSSSLKPARLWLCLGAALLVHVLAADIDGLMRSITSAGQLQASGFNPGSDKASYL